MQNEKRILNLATYIIVPLSAALTPLVFGVYADFPLRNNDFLENHYLSMAMEFWKWESLYNGFFPFGYSLVLKFLAGDSYPSVVGYLVNAIMLFIMFLAFGTYLKQKPLVFLLSIVGVLILPRMLRFITTPGPYTPATALFTTGALITTLVVFPEGNQSNKHEGLLCGIGGAALGVASLFRYHVLVGSVFFLLSSFAFGRNRRFAVGAAIALLLTYSPQFLINIMTDHGVLETANALNIYNLVYGVDWYHVEKHIPFPSPWEVIQSAPVVFARRYTMGVYDIAKFAAPFPLYSLLAPTQEGKKRGFAFSLFAGLYILFFGISASPCAPLLLIPLAIICLAVSLTSPEIPKFFKPLFSFGLAAALIYSLAIGIKGFGMAKEQHKANLEIEHYLISNGITNGRQVFTSDYELYFPHLFPYRPLFNGGWGQISTYNYSVFYPQLSVSSLDSFYDDCIRLGVRYVALNPDAGRLAGFLEELYQGRLRDSRFLPAYETKTEKILRIE